MAAIWISSLLLIFVGNAAASFDNSICDILKESTGLIPPPLPTNFELRGERKDYLNNFTQYEEMFFDYSNWRAKLKVLKRSIEYHYLFDYLTNQIVQWAVVHPGADFKTDPLSHICVATDMEDDPMHKIFGYEDKEGHIGPKIYTANQVLRYGGQYLTAFEKTDRMSERGLLVDIFVSCLYDSSIDATISAKYYFSNEKVVPAGATEAKEVTGKETGYLSVPVQMQYAGIMPDEENNMIRFNTSISIAWFKGEPEFQVGTFQIPPWVYCENYRSYLVMAKFPTAFSTRLTVTRFQVDTMGDMAATESESYEEIFYYGEKNLARRDFTPDPFLDNEIHQKFQNYDPVSTVYDFNQGVRYTTSRPTGRCYISPIYENEYFDSHEDLTYRKLGTPEEIFLMDTEKMEYKGTDFARDIECNVWTGKVFDKRYNSSFVKETYISTNGWHASADDVVKYGVPVKHVLMKQELDGELTQSFSAYNFLKFKSKAPRLVVFDINNCVELITHKQYALILNVDKAASKLLFQYQFHFLETAQFYLADIAEVLTPLRVQRLQLRRKSTPTGQTLVFLLFTLLDKADLRDIPMPVSETGANLQDATHNLQRAVDAGTFTIQFYPPGSKEATQVRVNVGDMYFVTPGGNLNFAPMSNSKHFNKESPKYDAKPTSTLQLESEAATERLINPKKQDTEFDVKTVVQHDEEDNSVEIVEEIGMTAGHLALLSIAMLIIGVGIGIAVMYLYVRMRGDGRVEDRVNLTEAQESSTGTAETSLQNASSSDA